MKISAHPRIITVFLLAFLTTLYGCTGIQPFPMAARAGDTITLAVGSLDGLTPANTTVTYYEQDLSGTDTGLTFDMTGGIRSIFKLYPDKTSLAWQATDATLLSSWSGHGPWMTTMVIDLPAGLPVGNGRIEVIPGAGAEYPTFSKHVETVAIQFQILPGTGTPHDYEFLAYTFDSAPYTGNLNLLAPAPQVIVRYPYADGTFYTTPSIAAAEYILDIPIIDSAGNAVTSDDRIRIVLDDSPLKNKFKWQMDWVRNGNLITVNLISSMGQLLPGIARFSVVILQNEERLSAGNSSYDINFSGAPSIQSVRYFDLNGYEVTVNTFPEIVLRN